MNEPHDWGDSNLAHETTCSHVEKCIHCGVQSMFHWTLGVRTYWGFNANPLSHIWRIDGVPQCRRAS